MDIRAGSSTHRKGGITHISKDNLREIGYYQADCVVLLLKKGGRTHLTPPPLDLGLDVD